MSYKLQNLKHGFFPVPHEILDGVRTLIAAECKLLVFLYSTMNRLSSPCIRISGSQLSRAIGMDAKTIRAARQGLESKRHIQCRQEKPGAPFEFHIVNPESGEPFPPEAGRSAIAEYKPRTRKADGNVSEKRERSAVRGPRASRVRAEDPEHAQPAEPLHEGVTVHSQQASGKEHACPFHPDARFYFDGEGQRRCEKCEPSHYFPPEDTLAQAGIRPVPRGCISPSVEEVFGHR